MKTFTHTTDNQLIESFQEGNIDALEVLVNRHKDRIFTCINILVKDRLLAVDLFQEVFFKIIDSIRANNYSANEFLPWAIQMAHTLCLDHFEKVELTPTITTSDDKDIFDVINVYEEGADNEIIKSQSTNDVAQILDLLPAEQKKVIVLRHYANLSFREISLIIGCSIHSALQQMRNGLSGVRRMMLEKQIAF